jgi:protein phosphatase
VRLQIPFRSLVLLIGPSGCGKSTFARKHFRATEVLSSDHFRALISDDEHNQSVSKDAFEILHLIAAKRLALGRLTVIDATNVQVEARRSLLALATEQVPAIGVVFDLPVSVCLSQNLLRPDRTVDSAVIETQAANLRASLPSLIEEGFAAVYIFTTRQEIDQTRIERSSAPTSGS